MRLNPIEFYEGYVISTTFALPARWIVRSFIPPRIVIFTSRYTWSLSRQMTKAKSFAELYHRPPTFPPPLFNLLSQRIQKLLPTSLWQNFPSIYRLVGARLKNLSLDESTRAEYLSLTGRVRGPALFFATREISRRFVCRALLRVSR